MIFYTQPYRFPNKFTTNVMNLTVDIDGINIIENSNNAYSFMHSPVRC